MSLFQGGNSKSWNQTLVCLKLFLLIFITRPLDFPEGWLLPGFIDSEFLSEDWTSSSVMADGCWYTPRLILPQILTFPEKTTLKPLYNSVWGCVALSLWLWVSFFADTSKHTHTLIRDLRVRYPISCDIAYNCGKILFTGFHIVIISSMTRGNNKK